MRKQLETSQFGYVKKRKEENQYSKNALREGLKTRLFEQDTAIEKIIPYLTYYGADLNTPNRPIGAFLLLGPTGSGKTYTSQALAELLHGSPDAMIRVDCGEYQSGHEVSKFMGSPPGYLGHKETQPVFTQKKLKDITSEGSDISIILFDEIEKAHQDVKNALLGVLDRGVLRLGDNTIVDFEKTLIFFTSNLSAARMMDILNPTFGFNAREQQEVSKVTNLLNSAGSLSVKKHFTPEFINRLDEIIVYTPLPKIAMVKIFDKCTKYARERLEKSTLFFVYTDEVRDFLIDKGYSTTFGARELNRIVKRYLLNPLADLVVENLISQQSIIKARLRDGEIVFDVNKVEDIV